ncbi:toll-like receptor 4 [Saccostrea echinata]|uniref:toll-like receptor 4 n=1 Tax=Saccostrea echinata TaxID=191078 RepID=UPI002A8230AA|nr:toll-like receptor 4 [Saccostrea echinata]
MEKKCSLYTLIIVVLTSLIIIALTTTVSRIVFRYGWKFRYMYYVAKEKYQGYGVEDDANNQRFYRFDAFISYADQDGKFVAKLVNKIENEHNLRLCIHDRDFIPGTGIMDNITNAIHCSRRTVCIMTSHFLNSYWCMFELNMARMETIYSRNGGNVLFLIILEKKAMKNIPLYLMDLIKNQSYLEYLADDRAEDCTVLVSRLGEILKSNRYEF